MGCTQHILFGHKLHHIAISFFILLISCSPQMRFLAEGRKLIKTADPFQAVSDDKRAILRAQIGSRPPRCDRRCSTCGHCEAIQVPTNPQIKNGIKNSTTVSSIAYARGEDNSNYKPMSWKCKCGNLIFNP